MRHVRHAIRSVFREHVRSRGTKLAFKCLNWMLRQTARRKSLFSFSGALVRSRRSSSRHKASARNYRRRSYTNVIAVALYSKDGRRQREQFRRMSEWTSAFVRRNVGITDATRLASNREPAFCSSGDHERLDSPPRGPRRSMPGQPSCNPITHLLSTMPASRVGEPFGDAQRTDEKRCINQQDSKLLVEQMLEMGRNFVVDGTIDERRNLGEGK